MVYACIAPHGGGIVPELAGDKGHIFAETTRGMRKLAAEMNAAKPDTIVIASPHNLRLLNHVGVVVSESSSGSLAEGGAEVSLEAKCDVELALQLLAIAGRLRVPAVGANYGTSAGPLSNMAMDWGTLIPLWFFLKSGRLKRRIVIVTPSREIPLRQNFRFGAAVGEAAEAGEKRVAFVASADQAHAHDKAGPYGYSPKAAVYDRMVVEAVKGGRLSDVLKFEPSLVEEAKPDGLWQMAMLAGALSVVRMLGRLHSYQAPTYFGMLCAGYSRVKV